MVANVKKPSRQLSAKARRLLIIRRAMKKLESINNEVRDGVHDLMDEEGFEEINIPAGSITRYESEIHDIDPKALYKKLGNEAWGYMKVKVGEAKKCVGKGRLGKLMKIVDVQKRLLTKPSPKKQRVVVNA